MHLWLFLFPPPRAEQYSSAIVRLDNLRLTAIAVLLTFVCVAGCRRPSTTSSQATPQYVPAPAENSAQPVSEPPTGEEKLGLSTAVARLFDAGHRTGSLVEHCSCGARGRIPEAHSLNASMRFDRMEQGLAEIAREYPEVAWKETSQQMVRVSDSRKRPGLLNVRIREFLVIEDRPPQAALPALWRTAEVAAYMHRHNIRLARTEPDRAAIKQTGPTVIQVKNATVEQILDRIVAGYHSARRPLYRLWIYRECRSGAETFVEIRVQ
jgi:hypothetical protein